MSLAGWRDRLRLAALAAGWLACSHAFGQQPAPAPEPPPALDLQEKVARIAVTVKDRYGREEQREIPVTIFRPPGDGPFPLVIMNHGRAVAERRATQGRARFEHLSRYLVNHGYVVMLPTRVGYGETYGDFDPESSGACSGADVQPMSQAASVQVLATLDYARSLPHVDASRWLVIGQSVGGVTAVATVARRPPGLLAGINFSGGRGGNPQLRPGDPCNPRAVSVAWKEMGSGAQAPMLWIYWRNDRYWGEQHPQDWHRAWVDGGGRAEFHHLPSSGVDGHNGLSADMDTWVPVFERFARSIGLEFGTWPPRPAADPAVRVDDMTQVPLSASARAAGYERFLQSRTPRAFAISPTGAWAWASGDWAVGRALGGCQARKGEVCKLYAVNDSVVWPR